MRQSFLLKESEPLEPYLLPMRYFLKELSIQ